MRFCDWGFHRWNRKLATLNPNRMVHRCKRCGIVRVELLAPRPPGWRPDDKPFVIGVQQEDRAEAA